MTREQYLKEHEEELNWLSRCIEVLGFSSIDKIESFVFKHLPSIKSKCRDWQDFDRVEKLLDKWEKDFVKDAYRAASYVNARQVKTNAFYNKCQEVQEVRNDLQAITG